MHSHSYSIWTNTVFPDPATSMLMEATRNHRWLVADDTSASNLKSSSIDPKLEQATIAFGQPNAEQLLSLRNLRWIHLTSAGYTAYDREDLRSHLRSLETRLTTSSGVYAEPCAQHVLGMMRAFARQLPYAHQTQMTERDWPAAKRREESFLLNGQTVLLCGYGEIAKRLVELLAPFRMKLIGARRNPTGKESIPIIPIQQIDTYLPLADHVINLLPANDSTVGFFDALRLGRLRSDAYFYNIGRGATVDQSALSGHLHAGRIAGAYLDVMTPEPLPPNDLLWNAPNCFLTPHTAGGFRGEMIRLVEHFLENLSRFTAEQNLVNQVI
jgi:phosphoglycerate dehydrogenase-like enzyme